MKTRSVDAVASPVEARTADARTTETQSVEKTISIDAIAAPTEARTKDLKRLNAIPTDAVVSSVKVQPEVSVAVLAGPMLATELVASPTTLPELSTSNPSPDSSPSHICKRSSRPASSDYRQDHRLQAQSLERPRRTVAEVETTTFTIELLLQRSLPRAPSMEVVVHGPGQRVSVRAQEREKRISVL
jgi:hypothetical protein